MRNSKEERFIIDKLIDPTFSDSPTEIAKALIQEFGLSEELDKVRRRISKFKQRSIEKGDIDRNFGSRVSSFLNDNGIDPESVKTIWHKQKSNGDITYSVSQVKPEGLTKEELTLAYKSLIDTFEPYPITYKSVKHLNKSLEQEFCDDERFALIINPADIHIGKLSSRYGYNSATAISRVREGVDTILKRASNYNVDTAIFVIGNDVLHVDSTANTTTKGTRQDVDGNWYDMMKLGLSVYADMINLVNSYYDKVHVVFCPSNHDSHSGFALAIALEKFFEKSEITFDVSPNSRKYFQYGVNMFGFHHGDGARKTMLPMLMATEEPKMWSESKYRYFYVHHVHHYTKEDMQGVTVETLRSPSEADKWHDDNGYTSGKMAVEGFLHEYNTGELNKISKLF